MSSNASSKNSGNRLIKEIEENTIKFIAAGEKINDIETAVRELVENSIDAKAKNIEIRLAKFGVDAIEVEDNGIGIDSEDFESLGSRYYTSKIRDYKQFQESLETFGFRGEALSCLCNIANVTITTKTKTSPTGWKLTFKSDGKLAKKEPIGRDNGTTVTIKNLFHSIPVRRRELTINAKKQYDRIVKLLYEQILARPHIKFSLCKKSGPKKEKDFTHGGSTLQGCLITIYGIKVLESLIPIRQTGFSEPNSTSLNIAAPGSTGESLESTQNSSQDVEMNDVDAQQTITSSDNNNDSQCHMISQPSHGEVGSQGLPLSSTVIRRQSGGEFFKRNCKSKFAREKPQFIIHGFISKIGLGRNSADCQYIYVNKKPCDIPKLSRLINEIYKNYSKDQYPFYCLFIQVQNWVADFNVPRKRAVILQEESKLCDIVKKSLEEMYSPCVPASQKYCPIAQIPMLAQPKSEEPVKTRASGTDQPVDSTKNDRVTDDEVTRTLPRMKTPPRAPEPEHEARIVQDKDAESRHPSSTTPNKCQQNDPLESVAQDLNDSGVNLRSVPDYFVHKGKRSSSSAENESSNKVRKTMQLQSPSADGIVPGVSTPQSSHKRPPSAQKPPPPVITSKFRQVEMLQNNDLKVRIEYLEDLPRLLEQERAQRQLPSDSKHYSFSIHPKFNTVAEDQLKLNLKKESFQEMEILGQFNKGFIITRLNKHLFIIDQHATDERANYEDQLEKSPLESQTMVHPKPLFLNLIQENAIINNIEAFRKRGFEFAIDPGKLNGYRVMLKSTSICKGIGRDVYLGKEDIEELIDVVVESPNRLQSYTLKKVKEVSASKACRMSVMIGDSLNWSQMASIVEKMSRLQNPWVCAHNRPTIRHLMDVDWTTK